MITLATVEDLCDTFGWPLGGVGQEADRLGEAEGEGEAVQPRWVNPAVQSEGFRV